MDDIKMLFNLAACDMGAMDHNYPLSLQGKIRKIQPFGTPNTINHYLQQVEVGEGDNMAIINARVLTNNLSAAMKVVYAHSVDTRRPVATKVDRDGKAVLKMLAISSGNWVFSLLEHKLVKSGFKFRFMIINNSDLYLVPDTKLQEWHDASTFSWATASTTFFLKLEGDKAVEWGLDNLGLELLDSRKSSKRSQEVVRMTEMNTISTKPFKMMIHTAGESIMGKVEFYDGKTYISPAFAIRMANGVDDMKRRAKLIHEIKNGILRQIVIRILTPFGVLKGDAIISPHLGKWEVVTMDDNIKSELYTDGYWTAVGWEHGISHMAVWDIQSTINFGAALTEAKQMSDLRHLMDQVKSDLDNDVLPTWLLLNEDAHTEANLPKLEKMSVAARRSSDRWQASGGEIKALQNQVYTALRGMVINRMDSGEKRGTYVNDMGQKEGEEFFVKTWLPMTNAMLYTVVTYESAHYLGGFQFPGRDRTKVFFDERVGLVIPGFRFVETYNLHGGWDQDDSVKAILIKVHCSDPSILKLHLGKTISNFATVPANAENARFMLLLVRSPNGPGEYSIEEADFDGMFEVPELHSNFVQTVDLVNMPLPQDLLTASIKITGMPKAKERSGEVLTRQDSMEMIMAQMKNPGIGRFCNSMMVWADTFGPCFPPEMLDLMENIVDTSQQGINEPGFEAIEAEPAKIYTQMLTYMGDRQVDRALAMTRLPNAVRSQVTMFDGRHTRFQRVYKQTIKFFTDEMLNKSMQWRDNTTLVSQMRRMAFPVNLMTQVEAFYNRMSQQIVAADAEWRLPEDDKLAMDPFVKMHYQYQHKLEMERIVRDAVNIFDNMDEVMRNRRILALYKFIVQDRTGVVAGKWQMGRMDRIITQSAAEGERNLMDILIVALKKEGLM